MICRLIEKFSIIPNEGLPEGLPKGILGLFPNAQDTILFKRYRGMLYIYIYFIQKYGDEFAIYAYNERHQIMRKIM